MASIPPSSGESSSPTVLGSDGAIDLSGQLECDADPDATAEDPRPADAWVADRDRRRTLAPPPARWDDITERITAPGPIDAATAEPLGRSTLRAPAGEEVHRELADRFALGDFAAVLRAAELQLGREPNDEVATQYARNSRERLEAQYAASIGSLEYVFAVAVAEPEIRWLGLDPQATALLSLVDGAATVEGVVDASRMERLEALRVFTELLEAEAIERVA